jgi:glycosyltransferase involved in cell wall biosynthesis
MTEATPQQAKVLLLSQPTIGGAALQVWQLAARLDPSQFRVTVASPADGWLRTRVLACGGDHREIRLVREIHPVRDTQAILALVALIGRLRPQIIHAHSSKAGILGRLAGRLCHVPIVVYTPHGFPFRQSRRWSAPLYLGLEQLFALFADRIICVSESEAAGAMRHHVTQDKRLAVIRNGVDIPQDPRQGRGTLRGLLGVGDGCRIIAMVSRLRRPKQPEDLLRAAEILAGKLGKERVRFVFIGDGPLAGRTAELAQGFGLQPCVVLLGDRNDVPALMPDIDVVVLASSTEGMPYSILEAMAGGKPVVGSRVPGIDDLIIDGKNGYCYASGDAGELADILLRLIEDDRLRHRLGEEGRRTVERGFTTDRMVRETQNLYRTLLEARISRRA